MGRQYRSSSSQRTLQKLRVWALCIANGEVTLYTCQICLHYEGTTESVNTLAGVYNFARFNRSRMKHNGASISVICRLSVYRSVSICTILSSSRLSRLGCSVFTGYTSDTLIPTPLSLTYTFRASSSLITSFDNSASITASATFGHSA